MMPDVDELFAQIAELQDEVLGLEHDLERVAEILRALGVTVWGPRAYVEDQTGAGVEVSVKLTETQAAVLDRLLLL